MKIIYKKGEFVPFICYCATVQVWFTPIVSIFYPLSTGDDDQCYVNQRLIESESYDTWNSLSINFQVGDYAKISVSTTKRRRRPYYLSILE